jgi:hypothetical protein
VGKDQDFAAFAKNLATKEQHVLTEAINPSSREKNLGAAGVV